MSDKQILALFEEGSYEVVPHDGMRRTIAQRLTASTQTVPHFYLTMDCDIGRLLDAREEINAAAPKDKEKKPLYKLSVNDFVIKALAVALQQVPNCNVSWTEGRHAQAQAFRHRRRRRDARRADHADHPQGRDQVAVDHLERDEGLRRPRAGAKTQAGGISGRHHRRCPTSACTASSHFTAVINPPQATILAVGASEERAVVRDGKIEAAHIMSVTLSCDHRAIDGALGAELIGAFKRLIENPVMMMV